NLTSQASVRARSQIRLHRGQHTIPATKRLSERQVNERATSVVEFEELRAGNGARIGIARLNAEKTLNALTLEMIDLMSERLTAWSANPEIALVVMEGAGEKAFCAG